MSAHKGKAEIICSFRVFRSLTPSGQTTAKLSMSRLFKNFARADKERLNLLSSSVDAGPSRCRLGPSVHEYCAILESDCPSRSLPCCHRLQNKFGCRRCWLGRRFGSLVTQIFCGRPCQLFSGTGRPKAQPLLFCRETARYHHGLFAVPHFTYVKFKNSGPFSY